MCSSTSVKAFQEVLEPAEKVLAGLADSGVSARLGKTAAGLRRLREQAHALGFAEGKAEGFAKGLAEGRAHIEDEMRALVLEFASSLERAVARVDAAIAGWYEEAESRLAAVAVAVAARIVGEELRAEPERVVTMTREAMSLVAASDTVRVRLNPYDAPTIRSRMAEIQAVAPSVERVEILDDPTIEGGCRIESESGVIDATVRTQIELALDALRSQP